MCIHSLVICVSACVCIFAYMFVYVLHLFVHVYLCSCLWLCVCVCLSVYTCIYGERQTWYGAKHTRTVFNHNLGLHENTNQKQTWLPGKLQGGGRGRGEEGRRKEVSKRRSWIWKHDGEWEDVSRRREEKTNKKTWVTGEDGRRKKEGWNKMRNDRWQEELEEIMGH